MNMYLGKDIIENLSGGYFLVKFIIIKLFFFYGPKAPKFFFGWRTKHKTDPLLPFFPICVQFFSPVSVLHAQVPPSSGQAQLVPITTDLSLSLFLSSLRFSSWTSYFVAPSEAAITPSSEPFSSFSILRSPAWIASAIAAVVELRMITAATTLVSTITSDEEGRSELPERHQLIFFSLPFLLHEPAAPAFTITTTLQPDDHHHLPTFISQSTARLKPTAAVIDSFFSRSTLVWCLMLSSCLLMFDVPIHSCWCLTFAELSEVIISSGQLCFG